MENKVARVMPLSTGSRTGHGGKRHFSVASTLATFIFALLVLGSGNAADPVGVWMKFEASFQSDRSYENPLYDVNRFEVSFTSSSGRVQKIQGFWDGGRSWKVRFAPDERGIWTYTTQCSDDSNSGLHEREGRFEVVSHDSKHDIYTRGAVIRPWGGYHLAHADGTPFFWTACTAWNGPLKATDAEWRTYLQDRAGKNYNVIQFVTTQWRGGDADRQGRVAFQGSGRIQIDPEFFQRLDRKIDLINEYGLVAAPVLLWALPSGQGRHLSPGYYLPDQEAVLLARYLVARYGGNQVVWFLGGDGRYIDEYEQRWKVIGRGVFGEEHPGLVAQHPHGRSWIGAAYAGEPWLDIVGYQSSHSSQERTVNWINKGPVSEQWDQLPPRPIINLEPIYEQVHADTTPQDVRNASYWSVFAAPPSGISYGANGLWSWRREGEKILNHRDAPWAGTWRESLELAGGAQIGYLSEFMQRFEWWKLKPGQELLADQPGDEVFNHFISVLRTDDFKEILVYTPVKTSIRLYNPLRLQYRAQWFDPAANQYSESQKIGADGVLSCSSPLENDALLILRLTR